MDLHCVTDIATPARRADLPPWRAGDSWLAGGTWLFSEPQPDLRRLVDLSAMGWTPLRAHSGGLEIAATCTIAQLDALTPPAEWAAAPLIGQCCRALLGSFKIWNMATVGGNICMALPAGPMTALAVALEGTGTIWARDGGVRTMAIADLVLGPRRTALAPGELLRRVDIPAAALARRTAFRRISLNPAGRSGALLIGTRDAGGEFALTVTAATRRPMRCAFAALPDAAALRDAIDAAIPEALWYDDIHGRPDWRRAMTHDFAQAIRAELA